MPTKAKSSKSKPLVISLSSSCRDNLLKKLALVKNGIYFVPVCHIVALILIRINTFYQMSLLVTHCDQLSLPLINYTDQQSLQWSAVPNNDYLSLPLISSPYHWSEVPNNDCLSIPLIISPYHRLAVPTTDQQALALINSPYHWSRVPSTDQQSLQWLPVPNNDQLSLPLFSST